MRSGHFPQSNVVDLCTNATRSRSALSTSSTYSSAATQSASYSSSSTRSVSSSWTLAQSHSESRRTASLSQSASHTLPIVGARVWPLRQPSRRGQLYLVKVEEATWASDEPDVPHFSVEDLNNAADSTRELALVREDGGVFDADAFGAACNVSVAVEPGQHEVSSAAVAAWLTQGSNRVRFTGRSPDGTQARLRLPPAREAPALNGASLTADINVTLSITGSCTSRSVLRFSASSFTILYPPAPSRQVFLLPVDASATVATLTASAAGSPAVGLSLARVNTIAAMGTCDDSLGEPLEFSAHPTGIAIGTEPVGYHLGAAVMNTALLAAFTGVMMGAAAVHRCRKGWSQGSLKAMLVYARLPSVLLFPATFMLQPTFGSALIVLFEGQAVGIRLLGGLIALVLGGAVAAGYRMLFAPGRFLAVFRRGTAQDADSAAAMGLPNCVTRALNAAFYSEGQWEDRALCISKGFVRRNFLIFSDYTDRAPWFFFVDAGLSLVMALIDAIRAAGSTRTWCTVLAWNTLAGLSLFIGLMFYLRPFESRFEFGFTLLMTSGQLLATVLTAIDGIVASVGDNDGSSDGGGVSEPSKTVKAAEFILNALMFVLVARSVYDIAEIVWEFCRHRLVGRLLKHLAAEETAAEAPFLIVPRAPQTK
jgi:hypothetical protein